MDIQVWDVAAAMTFFGVLALLPTLVALVSVVSLLGLREETAETAAVLVVELWPSLDAGTVQGWILGLGGQPAGTGGLVLGTAGAVFSASGAVAAFHRAMHRIHDTREGRGLIPFRFAVVVETLVLLVGIALVLVLVLLGGDLAVRAGRLLGVDAAAVETWDVAKWPLILVVIALAVTLAYYVGPNVRQPRYRPVTTGAVAVVALLFGATVLLGWISDRFGEYAVVGRLNSAIGVLVLAWAAGMVLVAGAAWDAEMLRARQLAAGLAAEDEIQLAPRHVRVLEQTERQAVLERRLGRAVRTAAASGRGLTLTRTALLAEDGSLGAVGTAGRRPEELSSGRPFHTPEAAPASAAPGTAAMPSPEGGREDRPT